MRGKSKSFPRDVKEKIWEKSWHLCANRKDRRCLQNKGLSIHHIIANTDLNAKLYGDDFLQSEENGVLLCQWCHDHHSEIEFLKTLKNKLMGLSGTEVKEIPAVVPETPVTAPTDAPVETQEENKETSEEEKSEGIPEDESDAKIVGGERLDNIVFPQETKEESEV